MKRKILGLLAAALLLFCMTALADGPDAGMGVFEERSKSGVKWIDQLMRRLDMPYTLVEGKELEPERLIRWYETAFAQGQEQGFFPVLMMPYEDMSHHVLRSGSLWENRQEDLEEAEEKYQERYGTEAQRDKIELTQEVLNVIGFYADLCRSGSPDGLYALILVPTDQPWQLPTYLPTGKMREDIPDNAEQTVFLRHWYNQHGCLPLFWGGDYWDVLLTEPPVSRMRTFAMAMELMSMCPLYDDPWALDAMLYTMQSEETGLYIVWWPEGNVIYYEEDSGEFAF